MPLTFDITVHPQFPRLNLGNITGVLARVTPDTSQLAGGELMEAGDFGLTEIIAIFVNSSTPLTSGTNVLWTATRTDANSWTLQAFESGAADAPLNEADSDNLTASRVDLLVLGV